MAEFPAIRQSLATAMGSEQAANDLIDQLENDIIGVYADATARDAALPSPADGMVCGVESPKRLPWYSSNSLRWLCQRPIMYVVAASDAPAWMQEAADYVCDGTADDVQIQAAIDAAESDGTYQVFLSAGTFTISATVTVPSYVELFGAGAKTLVTLADSWSLTEVTWRETGSVYPYVTTEENATHVYFHDFMIQGNTSNFEDERHFGLGLIDCTYCRAENIVIDKINYDPASATGGYGTMAYNLGTLRAKHVVISHCKLTDGGYECLGIGDDSEDVLVSDTYCGNAWRTSLQIHRSERVIVSRCTLEQGDSTSNAALSMHGTSTSPVSDVVIADSLITWTSGSPSELSLSAAVKGNENETDVAVRSCTIRSLDTAVAVGPGSDWVISNCHLVANGGDQGIYMHYNVGHITINRCYLESAATTCAVWLAGDNSSIRNTRIESTGDTAYGVFFRGSLSRLTQNHVAIENNIIRTTGTNGTAIRNANGVLNNLSVCNNTLEANDDHCMYLAYDGEDFSSISGDGSTVTVTVPSDHVFEVGDIVDVNGTTNWDLVNQEVTAVGDTTVEFSNSTNEADETGKLARVQKGWRICNNHLTAASDKKCITLPTSPQGCIITGNVCARGDYGIRFLRDLCYSLVAYNNVRGIDPDNQGITDGSNRSATNTIERNMGDSGVFDGTS